eukprot:4030492-Karenia_brevis.AAC.1
MGDTGGATGVGVLIACHKDYLRAMVLTNICQLADEEWQPDEDEDVLVQRWHRIWGIIACEHEKY